MAEGFYARRGKRLLDIGVVLCALPLLLPVAAAVALAVWLSLGRPVVFAQWRAGQDGRPFRLLKFRTLREGPGSDAGAHDTHRTAAARPCPG